MRCPTEKFYISCSYVKRDQQLSTSFSSQVCLTGHGDYLGVSLLCLSLFCQVFVRNVALQVSCSRNTFSGAWFHSIWLGAGQKRGVIRELSLGKADQWCGIILYGTVTGKLFVFSYCHKTSLHQMYGVFLGLKQCQLFQY